MNSGARSNGSNSDGDSEQASQDNPRHRELAAAALMTCTACTWLVAIVSGQRSPTEKFLKDLLAAFADAPVVIGPTAPVATAAHCAS